MSAPTDATPPPAPPTGPFARRGLLGRVLTLTPPWWGWSWTLGAGSLMVLVTCFLAWSGRAEPSAAFSAAFLWEPGSLLTPTDEGGTWTLVEEPGDRPHAVMRMVVASEHGPGWRVLTCTAISLTPRNATESRLDPSPLVIASLWAEAGAPADSTGPLAADAPPADFLRACASGRSQVTRGAAARRAWGAGAGLGLVGLILSVLVGFLRQSARARLEAAVATLDAGVCPACRYARAGLAPATPCPECGADPAAIRAEAEAALGLTLKAP